jgi:protoporphyrinogen oxidase
VTAPTTDVIVVGAGVAGLACARSLTEAGLRVEVLEASDEVGGRVRTDEVDGFLLDRGFQVLPTAYPEARRVLDYARLELRLFKQGAVVRSEGRFRRVVDPRRDAVRGLRSLAGGVVGPRDVPALLRLVSGRRAETTTLEALRTSGLSESVIDTLLAPFLRGVFLEPRLSTSSRFLEFVLGAFSAGPAALPAQGMGAIPAQLAEGIEVTTGSRVSAVDARSVTVAGDARRSASRVVVATSGLVDEPDYGWNGVSSVAFEAPRPPIAGPWLILDGDLSGPVNNLCVPTEVAPEYGPPGRTLVVASVLGDHDPDIDAVRHQLATWFGGGVRSWRHLRTTTVRQALPAYPSGARMALEPRLDSGVFACGDHREHPSLNGALLSGQKAAEAVIAELR